jgi:hypothetical protein
MNRFYFPLVIMAIYASVSGTAFKVLLKKERHQGYTQAVVDMPLAALQELPVNDVRI